MTFDDWFYDQFDRTREAAESAWDYQQERIEELKAENERILNHAVELSMTAPKGYVVVPVERIHNLEQWIAGIADDHQQIPDWIQQSARSLLAEESE